jgi:F-type H+-transporting ATPase subunit a
MAFARFFAKKIFSLGLILTFFQAGAFADEVKKEATEAHSGHEAASVFDFKGAMFHHLLDAYSLDFYQKSNGEFVSIHLPRIFLSDGLHFFGSTEKAKEAGYVDLHEYHALHPYTEGVKHGDVLKPEARHEAEELEHAVHAGTISGKDAQSKVDELVSKYTPMDFSPMDFSITKNVLFIFIAAALMLLIFISIARTYAKRPDSAPRGTQSFFEPIIQFVRDEIAKENIPGKYERFMPLLLTMFFFIWFLNMLGMIPFSANVTGNISVTAALALVTLIVVNVAANKAYWKHIFWPPVPHAVKPILVPVEVIGVLTKPFALTIRLFANITAGHVIMISLLGLIFIFGKMGQNVPAAFGTGIFSTLFIVAISCLEVFIALLQAYVFTMLTSVFIGQAVAEEEHH